MGRMKRILSILLVISLLIGQIPVAVFAADTESTAAVNAENVSIEGTNSFGNLLSEEIAEEQESVSLEENKAGYTVIDLTVEGNTAVVKYASLESVLLVVALYSEDGMQMLASGTAEADKD